MKLFLKILVIDISFFALCIPALALSSNASLVNPFIGTGPGNVSGEAVPGGRGGATQPAATMPFGMVQIGPDTDRPETSGYSYTNTSIRSFSLTHMSGPGCRNMGEVAFLPFIGQGLWPLPSATSFKHSSEIAQAGFYEVKLDNGTLVQLTATERTGMARITFMNTPLSQAVGVLINTGLTGTGNTSGVVDLNQVTKLSGRVEGGGFCNSKGRYNVFFAIEFDREPTQKSFASGIARIAFVNDGKPLQVKFGLSYVSAANALKNLETENPGFSFDEIREKAFTKWGDVLSTIEVDTMASQEQKTIFYTALYHSLLHPNIGSDVDGSYLGLDGKVHFNRERSHYVNFSGWDIYRSQVQLLAFLFPKRASDIAQSLIDQGSQCGALPKWSNNNFETNIMAGDPGALIIANIAAFGARDFDHLKALGLIKKSATNTSAQCQGYTVRPALHEYESLGYIPEPNQNGNWSSASVSLEYASADFGIANYASSLGDRSFASSTLARSANWRNLWDPTTGSIRPRSNNGQWLESFSATSAKGFMEGNSAQYTWMIPHDLSTLIAKMGGDTQAVSRLDKFLSQSNAGQSAEYLYLGNEPSFGVPWIYLWAHAPARTQASVRKLLREEFGAGPGGLTGNDDLGALSSWYVWSSLGLFPAIPGIGGVAIGSPAFAKIKITPEGGAPLLISAPTTDTNIYVTSVLAGRQLWPRTWMTLQDLKSAGTLKFQMSANPQAWGASVGSEPPSLGH